MSLRWAIAICSAACRTSARSSRSSWWASAVATAAAKTTVGAEAEVAYPYSQGALTGAAGSGEGTGAGDGASAPMPPDACSGPRQQRWPRQPVNHREAAACAAGAVGGGSRAVSDYGEIEVVPTSEFLTMTYAIKLDTDQVSVIAKGDGGGW